jgi:small subunit ribosomal protein S5
MNTTTTDKKTAPSRRPSGPRRDDTRGKSFAERPKPEFDQKILSIRRVTRVMAGGRRMTFAVTMAIGDHKGSIGLGTGKAADTALAITKALKNAKKNLIKLKLTKEGSIPHELSAKYCSSKVLLLPNGNKGLVAGSATRTILVLGGIKNITSKILSGSKNKLNNGRATIDALSTIAAPRKVEVQKVETPE